MSWLRQSWAALVGPAAVFEDLPAPDVTRRHAGQERTVDALAFVLALGLGALFLSPQLHDTATPLSRTEVTVDIVAGVLACVSLVSRLLSKLGVANRVQVAILVHDAAHP